DALQLHPQVTVVVLDHVAGGRGAGDDRAATLGDEHRGAHGRAPGVLEDDVGILAGERADLLAEPPPLPLVLGVLVGPELVALFATIDHTLAAHRLQELHPVGRGHHADRTAAAVE